MLSVRKHIARFHRTSASVKSTKVPTRFSATKAVWLFRRAKPNSAMSYPVALLPVQEVEQYVEWAVEEKQSPAEIPGVLCMKLFACNI